ncbi:Hpt domain-containing protein [Massilia sp. 9096]|uniref:Hpt domain-containing protein n=1 Tax=Massilia sp. 9096 TaxID=1500894 RepID=UPI00068D5664|nr:Hpt domain-containing protein [Massilia sp. 9096]
MSADADDATPAVDHAGGIARLMGDGPLFARVLARFRKEYRETAAGIRAALDGGDTPLALRLAHTLKGAAGMIEALPLRRAAQSLEQALRGGGGDPYAQLERLERGLERVLRELDEEALSLAPPVPVRIAPSAFGHDARARLCALLDEGNGDAVDLVREAEASLRTEMGDADYERLADAIESFDFDRALAQLQDECGDAAS